jgi:hypothetical protein
VFLANQSPAPARVSVSRAGTTFDVTAFARIAEAGRPEAEWATVPADGIPPDAVAVLFLSSDPESVMPETGIPLSCPVTPAVDASTVLGASGVGDAFAIATSAPVAAYDMLPYGGAPSHFPSAQLVLPESVWGTEHVVLGTPPGTHSSPGPLWVQVIARQDGTEVRVRPVVDLPGGGGAPAAPAGDVTSVTLSAGQYAQWELPVGAPDLAGSIVASDAPVAVLSGNRFFRLQDAPGPGGESTHQQIPPASALAHEYVAAPYETRRADLAPETIHYRLVGAIDGTMLAYDPPVTGAPATLAQGEVADFTATVAFVVRSQDATHPFAAAQIMPSANVPGGSRPGATFVHPTVESRLGDEELVVMLPPAQYLRRYVFFTDPSYATTSLTITRVAESGAFSPVTLECLGEVGGWIAAGTDGRFEVTTVDLVRADLGNAGCTNGRQVAASDAPFGIVVWGLDTYSSYAYPAGGNARSLAELPPLI